MRVRYLAFAVGLIPVTAVAQTLTLPSEQVGHVVAYLRTGGTRAEGDALAAQIIAAANADLTEQAKKAADAAERGKKATPEHAAAPE